MTSFVTSPFKGIEVDERLELNLAFNNLKNPTQAFFQSFKTKVKLLTFLEPVFHRQQEKFRENQNNTVIWMNSGLDRLKNRRKEFFFRLQLLVENFRRKKNRFRL